MKKVILALSMLVGGAAMAQSVPAAIPASSDLQVNKDELSSIHQIVQNRNSAHSTAKTNGGIINKQLVGFADTLYTLNGGSGTFGGLFQVPIYKDSTLRQEFSNTTIFIDQHAIGATYDPTSSIFGQNTFSRNDSYTIDSVHILGAYDSPNSIPNPSGDSLILEMVYVPRTNLGTTFNSVYFSPDQTNADTCFVTTPSVTVSSPGGSFSLTGTTKIRTGIELTANDTTATAQLYSIPVNQLIPADNIVGVMISFKSAYDSQVSTGDTVFSTVDKNHAAIPNFAGRVASDGTGTRYFCDFDGMNTTGWMDKSTLYQTNSSAFLNEILFPAASSGYFVYFTVSGTSTFGINENALSNNLSVYPNPSNGNFTIELGQGGAYTMQVINTVGQVVYSEDLKVNGNEKINRDFSNLAKGVYILNVDGKNYSKSTKLYIK